MLDEKIKNAWHEIAKRGGHFVCCHADNKRPMEQPQWERNSASIQRVMGHLESGGVVGVIPGKLGYWVLDQDHGTYDYLRKKVPEIGFSIPTKTSGHYHHWITRPTRGISDPKGIRNADWHIGEAGGEVRGDCGYVIVWDAVALADNLKNYAGSTPILPEQTEVLPKNPHKRKKAAKDFPKRALKEVAKAKPPETRQAGAKGRNQTLYAKFFAICNNGMNTPDIEKGMRDAAISTGLEPRDVDATMSSAKEGADEKTRRDIAAKNKAASDVVSQLTSPSVDAIDTFADDLAKDFLDAVDKGDETEPDLFYNTDVRTIMEALNYLEYRFRYNTLSARVEVKKREADVWMDVSDGGAMIRYDLETNCFLKRKEGKASYRITKDRFDETMLRISEDKIFHCNPFLEWVKSRGEWDGKDRLSVALTEAVGAEKNALNAWAGHYMFASVLIRSATGGGLGFSLDQMLFLIGPHGAGKSRFVNQSFPDKKKQEEWVGYRFNITWDENKMVEKMIGKVFSEAAEVHTTRFFSLNDFKAFLSSPMDEVRLTYHRRTTLYPRTSTLVGTMNDISKVPDDSTGNRRLVPIWCPGIKKTGERTGGGWACTEWWNKNRDQVWAQAWEYAEKVISGNAFLEMPEGTKKELDRAYEGARERDDYFEEMVEAAYESLTLNSLADDIIEGVSLTGIVGFLSDTKIPQHNISSRIKSHLRRMGKKSKQVWDPKQGKNVRRWVDAY